MFRASKYLKDKIDEDKGKKNPNNEVEGKLANEIIINHRKADTARRGFTPSSVDISIETIWDDEYKMYTGDQWSTTLAPRTRAKRKIRPNSVDNFVFQAVNNIHANITISDPEVVIGGTEDGDNDVAEKLTNLIILNNDRNIFSEVWDNIVLQGVSYGPYIAAVLWDNDWIGGTGPKRWVGDVRILYIDRRHIYFDPAITDLEGRLQECDFINRRYRKKLSYIKNKWPKRGGFVNADNNDSSLTFEGTDPNQVWLNEYRHKGLPKYMPKERKKELLRRANEAEVAPLLFPDPFKAKEYRDMAEGKLKGVHVAYMADGVILDYVPYEYDDGLYPFVYKVCYRDENSPHGSGEIRQIKVPQILHNKADEIMIEAFSREGLGGGYFNDGAITNRQLDEIKKHAGKGGMWFRVNQTAGMKDREGVKTPRALIEYKNDKQRMVETVSQNTPIQQGLAPSANIPYRAIVELGARTDVGTKKKIKKLKSFLIELTKMRINRFVQFYTEERYYRVKTYGGDIASGSFKADELKRPWHNRNIMDDDDNIISTGTEYFIPEFDINVKIMDEKPIDRNYYTTMGMEMFSKQAIDIESLWYTIIEGKFPDYKQILKRLGTQNNIMGMMQAIEKLPPEIAQEAMDAMDELMQQVMQAAQEQENPKEGSDNQEEMDKFLDSLPDEELAQLKNLPPEEQEAKIKIMMGNNEGGAVDG